jgi:hypothetical protein
MGHSGSNLARRPVLLVLPLAALVAVAVWQLVRPLWIPEPPRPEAWLDAARHVRGAWTSGDVVRIEPAWLTQGRVYFGDVDGGPREPLRVLDLHSPLDLPFLYGFERVWLVTAVELRGEPLLPDRFELVEATSFTGLTVQLFDVPREQLAWVMLDDLAAAALGRTDVEKGPCTFRQDRFRCGRAAVPDARVELREVAGGPRRCLLLKPSPAGEELALSFPSLDREGVLLVRAGNTVEAARSKDGGTVVVSVELDGKALGTMTLERASYRLDRVIGPVAGGGPHELTVRLTAEDEKKREVCLDGFVLAGDAVY